MLLLQKLMFCCYSPYSAFCVISAVALSHNYLMLFAGPEGWDEYFPACGGDKQSPININTQYTQFKNFTPFEFTNFDRKYSHLVIKNTGASGRGNLYHLLVYMYL